MENLDLTITISGIVSVVIIGFFGWIISIIKTQNRAAIKTIKTDSEIEKDMIKKFAILDKIVDGHEIKISHIDKEVSGVINKLESLQLDIGEMKSWIKEDNGLIRGMQEGIKDMKDNQKSLDAKIDLLIRGRGAKRLASG